MMFAIPTMCSAPEAFKTEVLKNAYKKIWTKNSISIVKIKDNVSLRIFFFLILAVVGKFKLKKQCYFFHSNKFQWFPFWKTYFTLLLASEALHTVGIAKITKLLRILYQLISKFLNFR